MLLDNNTKKVFDLINMYDNLSNIDKVRLTIYQKIKTSTLILILKI